jgi:hypothetical protein
MDPKWKNLMKRRMKFISLVLEENKKSLKQQEGNMC